MSFTTDAPVEGAPSAPSTTDAGTQAPPAPAADPFKGASTPSAPTEPAAPTPPASTEQLYTVKVDGEELQVSLEELTSGYSRTQDYTRKTQTLAEERKALREAAALQAAFDRDPHATLQALAQAFDWNPQGAQPQGQEQVPFEELDPLEQRVVRAEQFMETQQQQAVRQRIEGDLSWLSQTYGEFDQDELIAHAIQTGLDLRTAYKDMHFDKVRQQEASNAAAVDAKRTAQVVEGAGTVQPGAVSAPPPEPQSLRETIRAALRAAS